MLSLMLDPRFKGLEYVIQYVGVAAAKQVVEDYDRKILIPYLVKVHKFLNPGDSPATTLDHAPSNILFGAPASAEEACEGILIAELSLFRRRSLYHGGSSMHRGSLQFLFLHVKFWLFQGLK